MPPKAAAGAGNEAFLATCVKCAISKLDVDFDLVAKATGMSKGGAGNKFRAIMKQFEDEGATFTSNATAPAKVPPKRKAAPKKAATETEANGGEGEGDSDGEDQPAAKKAKHAPRKKGTTIAKSKKKAVEASASEEDVEGDRQVEAADEEEA